MGDPVPVPGFGKLSIASDDKAPLLVVFGGIDVGGVHSGVYMWKYMEPVKDRFHIFVANSNTVNGTSSARALASLLKEKSLTPPSRILYLFSGGYRPGMDLLPGGGASQYSAIFLVDIWMGVTEKAGSVVPDFYKHLVDGVAAKITYVYTSFGAANSAARDYIAAKAKSTLVDGSGMATHMSTNTVAVGKLP